MIKTYKIILFSLVFCARIVSANELSRLNNLLILPGIAGVTDVRFDDQGRIILQQPQKFEYLHSEQKSGEKDNFIAFRNKIETSKGAGLVLHYHGDQFLSATHVINVVHENMFTTRVLARRVTLSGDKIESFAECSVNGDSGNCIRVTVADCEALSTQPTEENYKKCSMNEKALYEFYEDVVQSGRNFSEKTHLVDAKITTLRKLSTQDKEHCLELCHELSSKIPPKLKTKKISR